MDSRYLDEREAMTNSLEDEDEEEREDIYSDDMSG
jgi:hypothetical protein